MRPVDNEPSVTFLITLDVLIHLSLRHSYRGGTTLMS